MRSSLTVEPLHDRVDGGEGQGREDGLSIHTLIKDIVCGGKEGCFTSGNLLATFSIVHFVAHRMNMRRKLRSIVSNKSHGGLLGMYYSSTH